MVLSRDRGCLVPEDDQVSYFSIDGSFLLSLDGYNERRDKNMVPFGDVVTVHFHPQLVTNVERRYVRVRLTVEAHKPLPVEFELVKPNGYPL